MKMTFKLEDFEGPLDLLLHLLDKNKMSIYDIEIAAITDQYMEYIDAANDVELEYMSEFIVMASTLLYIKSKMLLPKHEQDESEEDPREELILRLLEYKKIKYVSEELNERQNLSLDYCFRNKEITHDIEIPEPATDEILGGVTLEALYETFQTLLQQQQLLHQQSEKKIDSTILKKDSYTIKEKNEYIMNLLKLHRQIVFFELFPPMAPKLEMIVTFMSILELAHKKKIWIEQQHHLDNIIIKEVMNNEEN